nr:uncharacterized protein LOC129280107 [Lytechinus pictus]
MDSGLACSSRIQRLLWTQDYISLAEEVILLESSFVLSRRNNLQLRAVQVGLTSSALLIAEEKPSPQPSNKTPQRRTKSFDTDLELFELIYLFPLVNVRLSIRTHSEEIGEHVIRVRLCNGLVWYLELSDETHREDKWHEWVWWIHELEKRRKLENKQKRRKHRMGTLKGRNSKISNLGSPDSQSVASREQVAIGGDAGKKDGRELNTQYRNINMKPSGPTPRAGDRRQSTAHRWVHHFAEHIIDHHDETLADNNDEHHGSFHQNSGDITKHGTSSGTLSGNPLLFNDPLSHGKLDHKASKMWSESHISVARSSFNSRHSKSKGTLKNPMHSALLQCGAVDSLSSLEDIQSVGSLVSSNAESWTNRHAKDTRKGLILSIDDLFERTNVEAHAHGHAGRARPMASMTRLDMLLENGVFDNLDRTRGFGINKGEIHHTASLPDVLEGEASFIEDIPNADQVTHHTSLVYLDLENDDDTRTAHVINGHVMLLTKEEMELHKLVDNLRKKNPDPRLKRLTKKEKSHPKIDDTHIEHPAHKKKKRWSISHHYYEHDDGNDEDGHDKMKRRMPKATGKRMSIFFTGANRKLHILKESPRESPSSLRDVEPDDLANELTALDAELFLRIHEAEMVGCMWLKEDRNYRAPNVVVAIGFFKKIAGMVTKEILTPARSIERASSIKYFLKVADVLREMKNYHSLRAVLTGLQSPAVYRLRDTWLLIEEQDPEDYNLWQDLLDYIDGESLSLDNDHSLDQAMRAPPCLPFLGSVLMRIIDYYSTTDINGTRQAHKIYDDHGEIESTNSSDFGSAIDIVEGHTLEDNKESDNMAPKKGNKKPFGSPKSEPKLFSLFKKIAHKVDSLGHVGTKSSSIGPDGKKRMSRYRKEHIRMLILEYAKLVAEERVRVSAPSRIDSSLREKLLRDFEGRSGTLHGDVDNHSRSKHYSELNHLAHEHDDMPWKRKWTSEFHLHEALLQFQLSAVQYQPCEKSHGVRELLLKPFHHSDEENFKLSLEMEPRERFYSVHEI